MRLVFCRPKYRFDRVLLARGARVHVAAQNQLQSEDTIRLQTDNDAIFTSRLGQLETAAEFLRTVCPRLRSREVLAINAAKGLSSLCSLPTGA